MNSSELVADLLIEFLTEELPPINLEHAIGQSFALALQAELKNFLSDASSVEFFVTPRRFACLIRKLKYAEAMQTIKRKGPAIKAALQHNQPTLALLGFAKSCAAANWQDLHQGEDGYFYFTQTVLGKTLEQVLPDSITIALKKLPIAKNMRWGNNDYQFVRPVHNLLLIYGDKVICQQSQILGLRPVNYTYGHRVMSPGKIVIETPDNYITRLETKGKVIPEYLKRKNLIKQQLELALADCALTVANNANLLDEVTALVEYPVVLQGEFDKSFLEVPQECLILSMAKNQKYFALLDADDCLSHKFLFVANQLSATPEIIIHGNEKVLASRLLDAKFFYALDKRHPLAHFNDKLDQVVYHKLLGTQIQRIGRLQDIASAIAPKMGIVSDIARHCAYLLKADLTTEMVGEFPELQGVIGKYYAILYGETLEVANAIEQHYYPRFSGDLLPEGKLAATVALADKLETLVGIWGIGLVPSGDKDPYALRRAALGVTRILLEHELDLRQLLDATYTTFSQFNLSADTVDGVYQFILQRLYHYLTNEQKFSHACVQSVIVQNPVNFARLPSLLAALSQFAANQNNQPLLTANKRVENILKKNNGNTIAVPVAANLLASAEEKALYELLLASELDALNARQALQWDKYFSTLAGFNQAVTDFFANVMVMDDNLELRNNRIALLQRLYLLLNECCKLSELI